MERSKLVAGRANKYGKMLINGMLRALAYRTSTRLTLESLTLRTTAIRVPSFVNSRAAAGALRHTPWSNNSLTASALPPFAVAFR